MNAMIFLVSTVFNLYLMVVLLRLWLQLVRADFYNPLSQFIVKASNPLLRPLRRVIPGWGGFDVAAFILALLIACGKILTIGLITGQLPPALYIAINSVMTVISESFSLATYVLIGRAILSWFDQGHNPIAALLAQLTEPLVAPVRKLIPPIAGLDLSLLVVLIGLNFLQILVNDVISALLI